MEPVKISAQNLVKFRDIQARYDAAEEVMDSAIQKCFEIHHGVALATDEHMEAVLKEHGIEEYDHSINYRVHRETGMLDITPEEDPLVTLDATKVDGEMWIDPKDYPTNHGANPEVESLIEDTKVYTEKGIHPDVADYMDKTDEANRNKE